MALTVIVRSGDLATPASITFDAPRIVLGRGEGCEVMLPDPSISHRHASIRQRGTDYVVIDEGSTNGTFVGPVRLSPQAPRMVRSGDLIRLGRVWLELRIEQVPITQSQKLVTREIALNLVASALAAQGEKGSVRVWVQKGPAAELELDGSDRRYVIGRGQGIDLPLEDPDLSRRQVEFQRRGAGLVVRDLGSKNGSYLGGERLPSGKEVPWPAGVVLTVGTTELVYEDRAARALAELEAGQDEHLRDDEAIDPPTGAPAPERAAAERRAASDAAPGSAAPIAKPPREKPRPTESSGKAVGLIDVAVGLVALVVLGLSLFGLWMLARS